MAAAGVGRKRRVSPGVYKLLLAAHLLVSGGWLGVALAKLVLALVAATSAGGTSLYLAISTLSAAYPPAAIATFATGVLLSLGTKWGLWRHLWIVTKLGLSVGVMATGIALTDRLTVGSGTMLSGETVTAVSAPALLVALSFAHVLMLGAATVLSSYKPKGQTPFAGRPQRPARAELQAANRG